MTLKQQALKGVKWSTTSAVVTSLLQIAKLAVLARLIAKEDFGLFATIMIILGFADFFVEAGLGNAIIHRQNASEDALASAYTINILLGWLIFVVLHFASVPIANFYNDPRLVGLLQLANLIFLFQPFGRQYDALMRRDLRFASLAKLEIVAAVTGFVSALIFAFQGFAVHALIYSQLLTNLVRVFLLLWLGIRIYGFRIGFSREHVVFFMKFGSFQIGENAINYFNTQLDSILIAKLLGQEALGIFFMAKQIAFRPVQIINPIINKISLPVFARIQNDTMRLKNGYLRVVHTMAFVHFPVFIVIAGFSAELVDIFLGNNWPEIVVILQILAFYTMLRAIGNPVGNLLIAKGRVDMGFYWNLAMLFYFPPIIVFASQWGNVGVAWGLFIGMLGINVPAWYFLVRKLCGAGFIEYFGKLFAIAASAFVCLAPVLFVLNFWLRLLGCLLGLTAYIWYNKEILQTFRQQSE